MGRGSRIHLPTCKLMFRVYDYTNATRLLGQDFVSHPSPTREREEPEEKREERTIRVEGFDVHINPAGTYIVTQYDLYDVLAEIGFGIAPKSRKQRLEALHYKHYAWFESLHAATANTLFALARQFEAGGTEELENPYVFDAPDVAEAGGYEALKILGEPRDIIFEMKTRLFAV